MTPQIRHIAITSQNFALASYFYQKLFDLQLGEGAAGSDGYVGFNIRPQRSGRRSGFDHFGFQVEDLSEVLERADREFPECGYIKRPPRRPFAGTSMHDAEGNVFDLFQPRPDADNLYYRENVERQPTYMTHFTLKCLDPERLSEFYQSLFGLSETDKEDDGSRHLSDGVVTFVLSRYKIADYEDTGIPLTGLEHIGFAVPSLEKFNERLDRLIDRNVGLNPLIYTTNSEAQVLKGLLARCPLGDLQLSDPEGVLIDVVESGDERHS